MKNRRGKIRIEKSIIDDEFLHREILNWLNLDYLHIQQLPSGNFLYRGFSERFELIEHGSMLPEYKITIKNEFDVAFSVSLIKQNQKSLH